ARCQLRVRPDRFVVLFDSARVLALAGEQLAFSYVMQRLLVDDTGLFLGSGDALLRSFLLGHFGLLASCMLLLGFLLGGCLGDPFGVGPPAGALLVGLLLGGRLRETFGLGLLAGALLVGLLLGGRLRETLGLGFPAGALLLGLLLGGRLCETLGLGFLAGA